MYQKTVCICVRTLIVADSMQFLSVQYTSMQFLSVQYTSMQFLSVQYTLWLEDMQMSLR
jgi:hypothetical protein